MIGTKRLREIEAHADDLRREPQPSGAPGPVKLSHRLAAEWAPEAQRNERDLCAEVRRLNDEIGRLHFDLRVTMEKRDKNAGRAEKAEADLAACERERETIRAALREAQKGSDEAHEERMKLRAEAERLTKERDEAGRCRPGCIEEYDSAVADLATARAEADRLRGALAAAIAAAQGFDALVYEVEASCTPDYTVRANELRKELDALSPATPAAPSSAAPSSEYRRGYERAVEDACEAVRQRWLYGEAATKDAIRSLLPAPEREGHEADAENAEAVRAVLRRVLRTNVRDPRHSASTVRTVLVAFDPGLAIEADQAARGQPISASGLRSSPVPAPREVVVDKLVNGPLLDEVSTVLFDSGYSADMRKCNPLARKIIRAVLAAHGEGRGK